MFVDTHAHLYLDKFDEDIDDVIAHAKNMNVRKIFLPNIDLASLEDVLSLSRNHEDICFPMVGLHPCSVKDDYREQLESMFATMADTRYYGIGETGIDLYWDKSTRGIQIDSFEIQIQMAKETGLPVIIHSREALDLCIEIISRHQDGNLKGIFHCFNGTVEQCKQIADLDFMMGLGGVVTYKNAGLDDMVRAMPLNYMVLETDAPYLSPVPHRGKRNESSYIPIVAGKISELRGTALSEIMELTTINALNLFGIEA
ncbi:MAG: TatD family hydrolase [Saprospiraceae bacterium]|jgi:TatD DNase family protein